jgi:hypothetical protein
MGGSILNEGKMSQKNKQKGPAERVGDITPPERKAAELAYAEHVETCKRLGAPVERLDRFIAEHVECSRAKDTETPVGIDHLTPQRSYERMFYGARGFDYSGHYWDK